MPWLTDPQIWVTLLTLTLLEIVLGIDNIIFISILACKLPPNEQNKARLTGLALAMFVRVGLLFSITWVMNLTRPFFTFLNHEISGRDLILIFGGLFLMAKSTHEIHEKLEGESHAQESKKKMSFAKVITQIILLDIVFSLDSVITAVGMSNQIAVMISAVVIAVFFMMFFSGAISHFVEKHPTIKMLALSFLLLIGVTLVAEGWHQHISKGYIYFSMAFSVFVEMLNLKMRHKAAPIKLRGPSIES